MVRLMHNFSILKLPISVLNLNFRQISFVNIKQCSKISSKGSKEEEGKVKEQPGESRLKTVNRSQLMIVMFTIKILL